MCFSQASRKFTQVHHKVMRRNVKHFKRLSLTVPCSLSLAHVQMRLRNHTGIMWRVSAKKMHKNAFPFLLSVCLRLSLWNSVRYVDEGMLMYCRRQRLSPLITSIWRLTTSSATTKKAVALQRTELWQDWVVADVLEVEILSEWGILWFIKHCQCLV